MSRLINLSLLLSFLLCYLEWGSDQSAFIFQVEYSLLSGSADFQSFMHPLIFLPFIGQLILLYSILRKGTGKLVTLIGWILLSLLVAVILFVGLFAFNLKITGSTVPFLLASVWFFRARRKEKL
jgi:hypothetical protein